MKGKRQQEAGQLGSVWKMLVGAFGLSLEERHGQWGLEGRGEDGGGVAIFTKHRVWKWWP